MMVVFDCIILLRQGTDCVYRTEKNKESLGKMSSRGNQMMQLAQQGQQISFLKRPLVHTDFPQGPFVLAATKKMKSNFHASMWNARSCFKNSLSEMKGKHLVSSKCCDEVDRISFPLTKIDPSSLPISLRRASWDENKGLMFTLRNQW